MPLLSQTTASPSMMQERERSRARVSTISGKREIVAWAAVEPHAAAILAGDDAEAVMLDLVQPSLARWRLLGFCWKAGRDETGRQGHLLPIERSRQTRQSTRGDSLADEAASMR